MKTLLHKGHIRLNKWIVCRRAPTPQLIIRLQSSCRQVPGSICRHQTSLNCIVLTSGHAGSKVSPAGWQNVTADALWLWQRATLLPADDCVYVRSYRIVSTCAGLFCSVSISSIPAAEFLDLLVYPCTKTPSPELTLMLAGRCTPRLPPRGL